MASTLIVRHQCDRCKRIVEHTDEALDRSTGANAAALPEGWMLIAVASQPRLLCVECQDGLRMFLADNESVEQSR